MSNHIQTTLNRPAAHFAHSIEELLLFSAFDTEVTDRPNGSPGSGGHNNG